MRRFRENKSPRTANASVEVPRLFPRYDQTMQIYRGLWWFPTAPNERRAGTLTVDDRDSVLLSLDGSLRADRVLALRRVREPLIHGTLDDGTPVTLLEAYHDLVNSLGQDYFAHHTFIGTLLTASTAIDEVRFSGTELDNFLRAPAGVNSDPRHLGTRREATFRGHAITLTVDRTDEDALIDNQPRSSITTVAVRDWSTACELITSISLLLTLLTGAENSLLNVTITVNGKRAQVLTSTRTVAHQRAMDRQANSLIATADDIDDLDGLLARFGELKSTMRHVLGPFVAYTRNPGDITAAASQIAQTLESYHRDRRDSVGEHRYRQLGLDGAVFDAIRKSLEATMQREYPEHVGVLHQLRNDRSLRERVRDLYREHHELLDDVTDEKSLTSDATNNRNRFSHAKAGNLISDEVEEIFWSGERMRLLFYAILLTDLGFEKNNAHDLLRRNDRFDMLRVRKARQP